MDSWRRVCEQARTGKRPGRGWMNSHEAQALLRTPQSAGDGSHPASLTNRVNRLYNAARAMRRRLLRTGAGMAVTPRSLTCTIDTDHLDTPTTDVCTSSSTPGWPYRRARRTDLACGLAAPFSDTGSAHHGIEG
jgi:hypothetical protein